jgi:signal transduction histidine kinase
MERNINYILSMSEKYLHYPKLDAGKITLSRRTCEILPEVIEHALEGEQKQILSRSMKVNIIGQKLLTRLTMFVDPEMMWVVFSNLISNAVRYGREGGVIQVGFKKTAEEYEFSVLNEGEGIPAEMLSAVFQKFVRLDGKSGSPRGAGLGLFNAKEIVELHGGSIRAESEQGKWANFVITFPRIRVEPEAGEAAADPGTHEAEETERPAREGGAEEKEKVP